MYISSLLMASLVIALAQTPSSAPQQNRFDGSWEVVTLDDEDPPASVRFYFSGNQYRIEVAGLDHEAGKFAVDWAHTPPRVDIYVDYPESFGTLLGIFQFKEDLLTMHACAASAKVGRPKDFEAFHHMCRRVEMRKVKR